MGREIRRAADMKAFLIFEALRRAAGSQQGDDTATHEGGNSEKHHEDYRDSRHFEGAGRTPVAGDTRIPVKSTRAETRRAESRIAARETKRPPGLKIIIGGQLLPKTGSNEG